MRSRRTRIILFLFVTMVLISLGTACAGQAIEESPSTQTNTVAPSQTPIFTPTPIPTNTLTPTNTPTPDLPIGLETPIPQPLETISPENAADLVKIAKFGNGKLLSVEASESGGVLAGVFTSGVIFYDGNSLEPQSTISAIFTRDTTHAT